MGYKYLTVRLAVDWRRTNTTSPSGHNKFLTLDIWCWEPQKCRFDSRFIRKTKSEELRQQRVRSPSLKSREKAAESWGSRQGHNPIRVHLVNVPVLSGASDYSLSLTLRNMRRVKVSKRPWISHHHLHQLHHPPPNHPGGVKAAATLQRDANIKTLLYANDVGMMVTMMQTLKKIYMRNIRLNVIGQILNEWFSMIIITILNLCNYTELSLAQRLTADPPPPPTPHTHPAWFCFFFSVRLRLNQHFLPPHRRSPLQPTRVSAAKATVFRFKQTKKNTSSESAHRSRTATTTAAAGSSVKIPSKLSN